MQDLHDYMISSYLVDFEEKKIILYTKYPYDEQGKKISAIFENVTAHNFENEGVYPAIISEISCKSAECFLAEQNELLEAHKKHSWPMCYQSREDLIQKLHNAKQKYYCIHSSLGMYGFILAENIYFEEV